MSADNAKSGVSQQEAAVLRASLAALLKLPGALWRRGF